jgi:hypothetical protein
VHSPQIGPVEVVTSPAWNMQRPDRVADRVDRRLVQ